MLPHSTHSIDVRLRSSTNRHYIHAANRNTHDHQQCVILRFFGTGRRCVRPCLQNACYFLTKYYYHGICLCGYTVPARVHEHCRMLHEFRTDYSPEQSGTSIWTHFLQWSLPCDRLWSLLPCDACTNNGKALWSIYVIWLTPSVFLLLRYAATSLWRWCLLQVSAKGVHDLFSHCWWWSCPTTELAPKIRLGKGSV